MKSFFCTALLAFFFTAAAQRTYTDVELTRMADLGRVWGMLNYFHPVMGTGRVVTDSLIIGNAANLAADPSAENFRRVMSRMLGQVNDSQTRLKGTGANVESLLFVPKDDEALVKKLPAGWWYIALPTKALGSASFQPPASLLPQQWDSARGIVLDLRNRKAKQTDAYDVEFLYDGFNALRTRLTGNAVVPPLYERTVYHNGMVNQGNGQFNVYNSGWMTATKGLPSPGRGTAFNKPFAVVINEASHPELVKALLPLRAAGKLLLVYEGNAANLPAGSTVDVPVADGQTACLRVSDWLLGEAGQPVQPDLVLPKITDTAWNGEALAKITAALEAWPPAASGGPPASGLSLNYALPKPGAYAQNMAPPVGHRLFALYNYWNAIQYFFGYKNLLPRSWDSALRKHLPAFLQADDGLKYALAIRGLVADIHDSHGFVSNSNPVTPQREAFGYWPPVKVEFINDKLFVVDLGADSLQSMKSMALWDEIETIDGLPVKKSADKWRSYIASSNESTFLRDVTNYIINGPKDSEVRLGIRRGGLRSTVNLRRTGRNLGIGRQRVDFNDDYPTVKKLDGNVGYVNMGSLKQGQVDSVFRVLQNTQALVFDVRNYPQGTAWSIAPRLAEKEARCVRFEAPMVTHEWINGGEGAQQSLFYFTVRPDAAKPRYKGKVIVLCNQQTQSQAEYSIMMFQGATKVTVIGSQTAGADGNVTDVTLPGGYRAAFSGMAILYPDGTPTQRRGIKVDIECKPTLQGLMAGKDEVLERALRFIKNGN